LNGKGQYGRIKNDAPVILGWDLSGEVVAVGSGVNTFKKGDDVFGMINFPGHGKTYAEYVACPAEHLARKPLQVSHETAAATTLSALTAYQLLKQFAVKPRSRVLVQGAAGGVGYIAVQIARHLGAYVIGTARAKDRKLLTAAGLDELIDFETQDFRKTTGHIDMVLDTLGGDAVEKAFEILNPNGTLVTIPSGAGDSWKRVAEEKGINASSFMVQSSGKDMMVLADWLEKGIIKPHIAHTLQFDEIPDIHEMMEAKKISGKIVVRF
jgi:NADPH:quinone reductase-like Zn-dependent oxidoreductase